jgi:hypothetical protein
MRRTRGMRRRKEYSVSHTREESSGERRKEVPPRADRTICGPDDLAGTSSHVQLLPYEQGGDEERA